MKHEMLCAATSIATWASNLVEAQRQHPNEDRSDLLEDFRIIHRNAQFLVELIEEHPQLTRVLSEVRYFTVAIDGYSGLLLEQDNIVITTEQAGILTLIRDVNQNLSVQLTTLITG